VKSAEALLKRIVAVAAADSDLSNAFPGGSAHGIVDADDEAETEEESKEFRANFTYRLLTGGDEGAENTGKAREDTLTARFQCWDISDDGCLAKLKLLQRKFQPLGNLSVGRVAKSTRIGFDCTREPTPSKKGYQLWQGLLDIQYRVIQPQPLAV
jgi:hypothetical protein